MTENGIAPRYAPLALPALHEAQLPSGLRLVVAERAGAPLAAVCLILEAGSARDGQGKAGLGDFTLELLRRGTTRRAAGKVDEALELMGADLRLETSQDSTVLSLSAPVEHLEPALALLAELVQRPAFPDAEVASARKRTLALLETDLDDPSSLAAQALYQAALGTHPYAHFGRGRTAEVARFRRADCVAWHHRWIRPRRAALVVAGDVQGAKAIDLCGRLFGSWKGSEADEEPVPVPETIEGRRIVVVDKPEANQAQVRLACTGPSRLYPRILPVRLSAQMLGGGFTSRLVDAIRVTRGLSYGVAGYCTETEAGGLYVVSSYTKTGSVRELVDVALEEARRFREGGPTEEELTRGKRYTNGLYPLSLETVEQLARALAEVKRYGREPTWLERYRERIAAVTAEEATEEARRFFLPAGWVLAVVGEAKGLVGQLEGLGPVRVIKPAKLG